MSARKKKTAQEDGHPSASRGPSLGSHFIKEKFFIATEGGKKLGKDPNPRLRGESSVGVRVDHHTCRGSCSM